MVKGLTASVLSHGSYLPAFDNLEVKLMNPSMLMAVALGGTSDGKTACSKIRSRQVVDLRV